MGIIQNWKRANVAAKVICIMIVVYVLVAIYFVLFVFGVLPNILPPASDDFINDKLWATFSIISFSFATIIAAYHLGILIFKSKKTEGGEPGTN